MTITFTRTAGQIITGAMQDMRVLAIGESPTADEYTYGVARLNLMFKALSADGITPWVRADATAVFVAADAEVTLSPRPTHVISAGVQESATYERPLVKWEPDEYNMLPNKVTSGPPAIFMITDDGSTVTMTVWPVPSESTTIAYRYMRVLEDVDDENDTVDVPQDWLEGLQAMLAVRMPAFGVVPPDVMQAAAFHERRLGDLARPDYYPIEPGL